MNDDRLIEKLLRRYGKKRRDDAGAPLELHPATRRLLQDEVASQLKIQKAKGKRPGLRDERRRFFNFEFLTHHFPRLAWAVPLFVVVAIGGWALLGRPESKQLALGPAPRESTAANVNQAAKAEPEDSRSERRNAFDTQPATPVRLDAASPSPTTRRTAKNRPAEPALTLGTAAGQPAVSLADTAESKVATERDGYKELQRAEDKLDVAASAAPARARFAEAPNANQQKLTEITARSFDTKRVNTLSATPPQASPAPPQSNRSITGADGAKPSGTVAASSDSKGTIKNLADRDNFERELAQTYSQSFANVAPETLKQKSVKTDAFLPISPVLANFRVEQTGRQLRVVDGDGSTYVGETDLTPLSGTGDGGKKEQVVQLFKNDGKLSQLPAATAAALQPQAQNNFYQVAGTNRTLNQAVVFTWSFVEMTNPSAVAQSVKISSDLKKDTQQLPAQLQNAFINGRAQFETGQEIEINAVPVPP